MRADIFPADDAWDTVSFSGRGDGVGVVLISGSNGVVNESVSLSSVIVGVAVSPKTDDARLNGSMDWIDFGFDFRFLEEDVVSSFQP